MLMLKRHPKNPILTPTDLWWECEAVFNPSVVAGRSGIHMLYRAIGKDGISRLGYAFSKDRINFVRKKRFVLPFKKTAKSCEDPRITKIDNTYFITYTYVGKLYQKAKLTEVKLAITKDFKTFKRKGIIFPPETCNKDVVLFPEKINGKFVALHRPSTWIEEDILSLIHI